MRFEKDAAVQREIQKSADEIQQLKNTASSLRGELESLRFEKDAAVQREIQNQQTRYNNSKTQPRVYAVNLKNLPSDRRARNTKKKCADISRTQK